MVIPLRGFEPVIGEGTFVAPSANIIGNVKLGRNCSVWFHTTLRGDVMPIEVGDETNIQDNSVLHGTFKKCGVRLGNRVTVGHSVILHGCDVGDDVLIGMGSVIMDQAQIGRRCFVGAGSLVTENSKFDEGWLILGRPAKAIRRLTEDELRFLPQSAANYISYKEWYK